MSWYAHGQCANPTMTLSSNQPDQRAVSPIIGIILMVAITVILAAVVGTFVLGFSDQVQKNVQAGATIQHDGGNEQIRVTWTDNQNADYLDVNVTATNASGGDLAYDHRLDGVGDVVTIDCNADFSGNETAENVHITITGHSGEASSVIQSDTVSEC